MNLMKKTSATIFTLMLMLTIVSAQSRYKHVPRVKVDGKKTEKLTIAKEKSVSTTTATYMNIEDNNVVATEPNVIIENTSVASTSEQVVILDTKTTSGVGHKKVVKSTKKADKDGFTKKVKEKSKLMEVKDVKKTAMATWVLVMIILFAVGVILLAIGLILLFTVYYTIGVLVLLIIGGLCIAAGSLMLTLGTMGVI